jgi:hypothetical protein
MGMRGKTPGHRIGDLELGITNAQVAAHPALLRPGVQAVNGNVRAKPFLGDVGRLVDGGRDRSEAATPMQGHVPRLAILVTRRDAVSDYAQWKPAHASGNRIFPKAQDVLLDDRGKALAPCIVQDVVKQNLVAKLDAQSKPLVIELELKGRQSRSIDQGDELQLRAPGIVQRSRVVEPQAKHPIPSNSTSGKNVQGIAFFASETLHRIPEQCSHAHGKTPAE